MQGWAPRIGHDVTLDEVVERAFDYRGNVTVRRTDGSQVVGYLFNRNGQAREPFVQLFDEAGAGPITVPYAAIAAIEFTGRDTATGRSWKAWQELRERERTERAAPGPA